MKGGVQHICLAVFGFVPRVESLDSVWSAGSTTVGWWKRIQSITEIIPENVWIRAQAIASDSIPLNIIRRNFYLLNKLCSKSTLEEPTHKNVLKNPLLTENDLMHSVCLDIYVLNEIDLRKIFELSKKVGRGMRRPDFSSYLKLWCKEKQKVPAFLINFRSCFAICPKNFSLCWSTLHNN